MSTFANPVLDGGPGADHGDPFVLREAGRYLLFHTGGDAVPVYESRDLVDWTPRGHALRAGSWPYWAQVDLWAPEVLRDGDELHMYVTATQPGAGRDAERRVGLARSADPLGPFALEPRPLVEDRWSIDAHPHRDEDGSLWLFYNTRTDETRGPGGAPGSGNVVDRLVAPDTLEGRPTPVVSPDARWEANAAGRAYWAEGPWVLRRRGALYQQYSGGLFSEHTYAVGGASAPSPRGPWVKDAANPTFRGSARIQGGGHNCVVVGPDGVTPYAVYHGRLGAQRGRKVHIDRLWWVGERPLIAALDGGARTHPTSQPQPRPPEAVRDSAVAHWHATVWVRGGELTVDGHRVALPDGQLRRVELSAPAGERITVRVDDVAGPSLPAGPPAFAPAAGIVASTVASCLEDEALRTLEEGATHTWAWGGAGPVEVSLAVRGRAEVRAGDARRTVRTRRGSTRLVVLVAREGAATITVHAGRGGATVSDLLAIARDQEAAADMAAFVARMQPTSPLQRLARWLGLA